MTDDGFEGRLAAELKTAVPQPVGPVDAAEVMRFAGVVERGGRRRRAQRWSVATAVLVALAATLLIVAIRSHADRSGDAANDGRSTVPVEFRHACGHPRARVWVRHVPVTVRRADCDLSGVLIRVHGQPGAHVPNPGYEVATSTGLTISVAKRTGDVTITAVASGGNV